MSEATLDGRGHLTLSKEIRERCGEHYHTVQLRDDTKLVPVRDDPLGALRTEFADVKKTAEELRHEAQDMALDEAGH